MEADERGNERERRETEAKKEREHPYELMRVCLLRSKCPKSQIF